MPRLLELFAGTGSVGKAFAELGWEVVSVDNCAKFSPDILSDILVWDHTVYPPGHFDVVHASPPCTQYSRARTVGPPRDLDGADLLVQRALEIMEYFQPKYWWLENPATGLMSTRPCVQHLGKPYRVDYCQYGAPYRKATHLWSNCPHLRPRVCTKRCWFFNNGKHTLSAQRGPNVGEVKRLMPLHTLYKMPGPLCDDMAWASCQ